MDEDQLDVDSLLDGLSRRGQLIADVGEIREAAANSPAAAELAAEIQRLDTMLAARMGALQQATRERLQNVQHQKRGHNAYNAEYAYGSAFIDRKE